MRLIQICASRNDLFGLDDGGTVYRYNFNTKAWTILPPGSPGDTESPSGGTAASMQWNGAGPQTRDVER
jgi:hypothetical protein